MQNSKLADGEFILDRINKYLVDLNEPKFRQRQILDAVFKNKIVEFEKMTNLSKNLREKLKAKFGESILPLKLIQSIKKEQTEKFLFELSDGNRIESVEMEYQGKDGKGWNSLCISTQVGCGMDCLFCATGKIGFKRNLSIDEIVGQVLWCLVNGKDIKTISLMGMGEPLANPDIFSTLEVLTNPDFFGFGQRRINISTVGIVPQLEELIKKFKQINISLSLHSALSDQRKELMPIAKVYSLKQIFEVLDRHILDNKRKVFLNYICLRNINDLPEHAQALVELIKSRGSAASLYHINLIKYHSIGDDIFKSDNFDRINFFKNILEKEGINVTIRKSFGENIEAACGQLYAKYESKTILEV